MNNINNVYLTVKTMAGIALETKIQKFVSVKGGLKLNLAQKNVFQQDVLRKDMILNNVLI